MICENALCVRDKCCGQTFSPRLCWRISTIWYDTTEVGLHRTRSSAGFMPYVISLVLYEIIIKYII